MVVDVGKWAVRKAKELWPELALTPVGGEQDRLGIDAYYGDGLRVQIKGDKTMAESQRVYHEIYEKNKGHPEQDWRHSPANADLYIFVTGNFAIMTSIHSLAIAEVGKKLQGIEDRSFRLRTVTSAGFLIPIDQLTIIERRDFDYSIPMFGISATLSYG